MKGKSIHFHISMSVVARMNLQIMNISDCLVNTTLHVPLFGFHLKRLLLLTRALFAVHGHLVVTFFLLFRAYKYIYVCSSETHFLNLFI